MDAEQTVRKLLEAADIKVNGDRAWDIAVHDPDFYQRALRGNLGVGEAYMDGWWDCDDIAEMANRLLRAQIDRRVGVNATLVKAAMRNQVLNLQNKARASRNAKHHYNIGNDLYELMLDPRMIYSCAYWDKAKDLAEAQEHKLDLICRKLQLKEGMTLLDVGCGWGGLSLHAATKYGVKVTGISPADEQIKLARERDTGNLVDFKVMDYRDVEGSFDRVVSVGMLEHVGGKNWKEFFAKTTNLLKDDGIMLHHTIARNRPKMSAEPWIEKYIFPGGELPTLAEMSKITEPHLAIEDVHNFGPDYDLTLIEWHKNFNANWDQIADKYGDRFKRMWDYYLLSCAGAFRARNVQLYQIVFRKHSSTGTYRGVR